MSFQNAHFSRVRDFRQGKPPLHFVADYVIMLCSTGYAVQYLKYLENSVYFTGIINPAVVNII